MKNIETIDDLKKYIDSDEYKSIEKEVIELVKKCAINQIKSCEFVFDDKNNVLSDINTKNKERKNKNE